ncbi:hypothetical protein [Glycomyces tenuis]|uniref:hypothetical protein n=1 Tax=Glycomyces tenuis TaxID=58116 RepID=UPI0012DCF43D|nr:hypothetical protein [Glycomyces tenuis]
MNRRQVALWLVALTAMLTMGHLLGSTGDPHMVISPDHIVELGDMDPPSHDDDSPVCGEVSLPVSCAYTPVGTEAAAAPPETSALASAAGHTVSMDDRSPPDLVAVLQVNRV